MDLAGLASFEVTETWNQFLFTHLVREQPKGFLKISLQQILDTDKQLFILASHQTMGRLSSSPDQKKPLDEAFEKLKDSNEVLQFLTPLPAQRSHDAPAASNNKGGHPSPSGPSKPQLPDGCVTHDDERKPLCFAFQSGKCKFKGPAGKRCARGYHKCYKRGSFRPKPYYLCNHTD